MPKGPNGQKRPADAIGLAVMIGKIATGEIEDTRDDIGCAPAEIGRRGGLARARILTEVERRQIAQKAATHRWKKAAPAPETEEEL